MEMAEGIGTGGASGAIGDCAQCGGRCAYMKREIKERRVSTRTSRRDIPESTSEKRADEREARKSEADANAVAL